MLYRIPVYRCARCHVRKHEMKAALLCCGLGVLRFWDILVPLSYAATWRD